MSLQNTLKSLIYLLAFFVLFLVGSIFLLCKRFVTTHFVIKSGQKLNVEFYILCVKTAAFSMIFK